MPRGVPLTQEWRWFVWSDQRLYYTTTTVSGQCNPFINQLPSGYKLRQTHSNASKDYDYDNIYVLPIK